MSTLSATDPDSLIETVYEDERWEKRDLAPLAHRAATAALDHLKLDPTLYEISLLACDDARIAVLNQDFRGKPTPTNVLSWPSQDRAPSTAGGIPQQPERGELGDIAIAYEICAREAADQGIPFSDHVTHLIVHGVLHLLGYDHENDADATLMESLETSILAEMGIKDPYKEATA